MICDIVLIASNLEETNRGSAYMDAADGSLENRYW